ncbi:hypothetical protein CTL2C_940 [Chlamydia trachomatis L2c]|nr:hypothetical protein CTL2C_940 [Chlamydia trachomatis L2c]
MGRLVMVLEASFLFLVVIVKINPLSPRKFRLSHQKIRFP